MTSLPAHLSDADQAFLLGPRIGFLTVAPRPDEWPTPVPVWFEPVDHHDAVQLFTSRTSRKAHRLAATPRASLVAANEIGEPENWVAVTGPTTVETDGAQELAIRLAERYWDLANPDLARIAEGWRTDHSLIRVVIQAERVTRYA